MIFQGSKGYGNLYLALYGPNGGTYRTSGTTFTAIASVNDAAFQGGLITVPERLIAGKGTGLYNFTFPAIPLGCYPFQAFDSASALADEIPISSGYFNWDGANQLNDAALLDDAALNRIADHVIRRSWANAYGSSYGDAVTPRSLLGQLARQVNRWGVVGGNLVVCKDTDDLDDPFTTIPLLAASEASIIVGMNPSG